MAKKLRITGLGLDLFVCGLLKPTLEQISDLRNCEQASNETAPKTQ